MGSPKMDALMGMPLSKFGKVEGDVITIRGPEVIKGTGIRAIDIGLAAATAAGVVAYKMGKAGKEIKIGTPTPKNTGPKRLTAKPDPLKKFRKKAYGGKIMKKYAKGGGIRKAKTYG